MNDNDNLLPIRVEVTLRANAHEKNNLGENICEAINASSKKSFSIDLPLKCCRVVVPILIYLKSGSHYRKMHHVKRL